MKLVLLIFASTIALVVSGRILEVVLTFGLRNFWRAFLRSRWVRALHAAAAAPSERPGHVLDVEKCRGPYREASSWLAQRPRHSRLVVLGLLLSGAAILLSPLGVLTAFMVTHKVTPMPTALWWSVLMAGLLIYVLARAGNALAISRLEVHPELRGYRSHTLSRYLARFTGLLWAGLIASTLLMSAALYAHQSFGATVGPRNVDSATTMDAPNLTSRR